LLCPVEKPAPTAREFGGGEKETKKNKQDHANGGQRKTIGQGRCAKKQMEKSNHQEKRRELQRIAGRLTPQRAIDGRNSADKADQTGRNATGREWI